MEKVLLIGKLNQTVSSVNHHLTSRFKVQMCVDELEQVVEEVKKYEPDLVLISLIGVGQLDEKILEFFQEEYPKLPVLLLGTMEECRYYQSYHERRQFNFAVRPITLSVLMKRCLEVLKITDIAPEQCREATKEEKERRKRILAVDDNGVLLRSVKAILEKKYDISLATSGPLAMKQAKKNIPDLILLDYEMPEWDGKKTLEEIQKDEQLKDIPVVFLTGMADRAHIFSVLKLNPAGYLLKPIEQDRLFETIEEVLTGIV